MFYIPYEKIVEYISYHHTKSNPINLDFHLHEGFEIYFLISGDVDYFVENKFYPLRTGDLIITNTQEIHKPAFNSSKTYERIVLEFNPDLLSYFSSEKFNLLKCFLDRPIGEQNKVTLNPEQRKDLLEFFYKIEALQGQKNASRDILKLNYLIELLVYINIVFMNIPVNVEHKNIHEKLIPIIDYIDQHLSEDLSLQTLEEIFYINKYYLSKLFKNNIGSNLHEYIIFKRISMAKTLLTKGVNVTDTCSKCGFNDYSNFLKMFKRTVGFSPGQYKK